MQLGACVQQHTATAVLPTDTEGRGSSRLGAPPFFVFWRRLHSIYIHPLLFRPDLFTPRKCRCDDGIAHNIALRLSSQRADPPSRRSHALEFWPFTVDHAQLSAPQPINRHDVGSGAKSAAPPNRRQLACLDTDLFGLLQVDALLQA